MGVEGGNVLDEVCGGEGKRHLIYAIISPLSLSFHQELNPSERGSIELLL